MRGRSGEAILGQENVSDASEDLPFFGLISTPPVGPAGEAMAATQKIMGQSWKIRLTAVPYAPAPAHPRLTRTPKRTHRLSTPCTPQLVEHNLLCISFVKFINQLS